MVIAGPEEAEDSCPVVCRWAALAQVVAQAAWIGQSYYLAEALGSVRQDW